MRRRRESWWLQNTQRGLSYYVRYVYVLGVSTLFLCVPWAYNSCQNSEFSDPTGGELYAKLEPSVEPAEQPPSLTHTSQFQEFYIQDDSHLNIVLVLDVSCSMGERLGAPEQLRQAIQSSSFNTLVQALQGGGFEAHIYLTSTVGHTQLEPLVSLGSNNYISISSDLNAEGVQAAQAQLTQAVNTLRAHTCSAAVDDVVNDCECGIKSAERVKKYLLSHQDYSRRHAKWVGVVLTDENDKCQQQGEGDSCAGDDVCTHSRYGDVASGLEGAQLVEFKNTWQWYSVVQVRDDCLVQGQFPDYESISEPEAMWDLSDARWSSSLFQSLARKPQRHAIDVQCELYDNNFELTKRITEATDPDYTRGGCAELPCWRSIDTSGFVFNRRGAFMLERNRALNPGTYKIYYHCQL